ncbi:MAG: sulfatase [Verrucomicrobiales bacterium]|nr:sulfatase [Verrucomicrobiales bacterium]
MKTRLLLACALVIAAVATTLGAESKPNIIIILADDLGACDLGYTGSKFYDTPNIDRLAHESMRFNQAYAACPVCSPTRAAMMTGKYPSRTGITDWIGGKVAGRLLPAPNATHLALEEVTIAESLKKAGYITGHIGKWHLGGEGFMPEQQGFDYNFGGCDKGHPPSYFSPYKIQNLPDGPVGEYLTDRLATECEKFIEANKAHPFFLNFCTYAVHTPLQAKQSLIEKYAAKPQFPAGGRELRNEGKTVDHRIQNNAVYGAMVESLDDSIGRVLAKLKELGLDKNTLIIFTSDNGGLSTGKNAPTSNAPFRAGKGWLYEGGIREALVIKWPGMTKPNSQCETPVITMDFYPTILTAAGAPKNPQQHRDGVDLTPLLKGGSIAERPLFWHYPHYGNQGGQPASAIRVGDWKLIEWMDLERTELFNLKDDVTEMHDLASANPKKFKELQAQLNQWRKDIGAVMPTVNPDWNGDDNSKRRKKQKP